jgi:hypothetical protein
VRSRSRDDVFAGKLIVALGFTFTAVAVLYEFEGCFDTT